MASSTSRIVLFTMRMTGAEREMLDRLTKHRKMRHGSELVRQLLSEEEHHQARIDAELAQPRGANAKKRAAP